MGDRTPCSLVEVELTLEHVVPRRTVRVLEVRHPRAGAGVEGVYRHLPVRRTGKLYAPVLQILGDGRYLPVALPNLTGLGQKVRLLAGVVPLLALGPFLQDPLAAPAELPAEL